MVAMQACACVLDPSARIVGDSRENTSVFSCGREPGRPKPFPDVISGKKKEQQ